VAAPDSFPSRVPRTDLDRVRGKPSNRRQQKPNPNRLLVNPFAKSRTHHVPQGVIKLKKKEFQDLKQGSMSVNEYVTKFTQLSHYALHEVNIDEKKQECFLNGLNDGPAYALEA
jgi:hypothetical protein